MPDENSVPAQTQVRVIQPLRSRIHVLRRISHLNGSMLETLYALPEFFRHSAKLLELGVGNRVDDNFSVKLSARFSPDDVRVKID